MNTRALRLGDLVREHDGCHIGKVVLLYGSDVTVRWIETGWRSTFRQDELMLVEARAESTIR